MPSLITENPWPLILALACITAVAFLRGSQKTGPIALVCLLAGVGLVVLAALLNSPREELSAEMSRMLDNFKSRDLEAITDQIAPESAELAEIAAKGLELVELGDSFHMKSPDITLDTPSTATALVRANGFVTVRGHSAGTQRVATYWRTVWKKSGSRWKLVEAVRLNITSGEEQDYFSSSHQTYDMPARGLQRITVTCGRGGRANVAKSGISASRNGQTFS